MCSSRTERIGRIPTPESIALLFEEEPEVYATGTWTTGMTLNTSIGQGDVLATPLQIATAYAAIANGGTVYAPNLALSVNDPITDEVEISYEARVINELYYPPLISEPISAGLAGVTTFDDGENEGTATQAFAEVSSHIRSGPLQVRPARPRRPASLTSPCSRGMARCRILNTWVS